MKTAFTLFFFLFSSLLIAQPTITASWAPSSGDMVQDVVGANANVIGPADSGANASWDYSGVMQDMSVPVAGFEYADPSVSSFANLFPDANLAVVVSGSDPNTLPTTFYKKSSGQFELQGNALPTVSFIYTDPQILMQFPFSYGDNFEDDFTATNDIAGIMNFSSGHVIVTADAYGTIKTPKGTFEDVIRIKTETNKVDSTAIGPGSYSLVIENIINYAWFKNTVGNNVASLTITNGQTVTVAAGQTFADTLQENRAFSWNNTSGGTSSLKEINGNLPFNILSYGPNPTVNNFSIKVNSDCSCPLKMELTNYMGQTIKSEKLDLFYGENEINIQVGDFPAGNYFIKLFHDDGHGVFQIQKIK